MNSSSDKESYKFRLHTETVANFNFFFVMMSKFASLFDNKYARKFNIKYSTF